MKDFWDPEEEIEDDEDYEDYYETLEDTRSQTSIYERVVPSATVREGLSYAPEDVEALVKYVLITPSKVPSTAGSALNRTRNSLSPHKELTMIEFTEDAEINEVTVKFVFDVYPCPYGSRDGTYAQGVGDTEIYYEGIGKESFLINFCAFLIMLHLIPEVKAHMIYQLILDAGGKHPWTSFPRGVDYGPVWRTIRQEVDWCRIGEIDYGQADPDGENNDFEGQKWWLTLLTQEGKTDEEILKDAWMGKGNLWVYKHPGMFPIQEAVELDECLPGPVVIAESDLQSKVTEDSFKLLCLPTELMRIIFGYLRPEEVLHLISATRILYQLFRGALNEISYEWMKQERPWYFPVGPVDCEGGEEEIVRWMEKKEFIDIYTRTSSKMPPWFAYHLACRRSANMRNRERIWRNVLKIRGVLEDAQMI
jgi:hypothetical protein